MDLLYHLTGKNLIDLWKKEVITSLLFCTKASLLVTNNSSPSLGIFATPARCFLWSENIAPPHKSEKEQRSLLFLGSRFCAPARNRTSNNGLEVRSYIHLTTGAWCAMRDLNPRPFRCKRIALPTELIAQIKQNIPVAESYHIFRKIQ